MGTFIPSLANAEVAVDPSTQKVVPTREIDEFAAYTEEVTHSILLLLSNIGGLNINGEHPHALTEHQEEAGDQLASLTAAGNTDVGQVFKASQPNVDSVSVRLGVDGAGAGVFSDDFEGYADEAALDAAWVQSDSVNTPGSLETSIVKQGTQALRIDVLDPASLNDTLTRTFASEDWSTLSDLQFWIQSDQDAVNNKLTVRIGDGTNTKSLEISTGSKKTWSQRTLAFALFVNDGPTPPNMAAITTVEFEVTTLNKDGFFYIDAIRALADPGTIDIELWSVASATPTTLGTLLATATLVLSNSLDDRYHGDFGNVAVTSGSHYAIVVTNPSNTSITVWLLGRTAGGYTNGHAITSADDGTTVTVLTGKDAAFEVWSRVLGVVDGIRLLFDAAAGNAVVDVFVENTLSETIPRYFVHGFRALGQLVHDFPARPYLLQSVNEEVEFAVQHDRNASATQAVLAYRFLHKPLTING